MHRLRTAIGCLVAAVALAAVALWPRYVIHGSDAARAASLPAPVPVTADGALRDRQIAFWERVAAEHHRGDMLTPDRLSALYLERYRERGDIDDVLRSVRFARLSLHAQPRGNVAAVVDLGSAYVALHRFAEALAITRYAERLVPGDAAMLVREASVDLELGRYDDARTLIERLSGPGSGAVGGTDAIALDTLRTRYDELTGHLARARERFATVTAHVDARYDQSAQQRAWFWFRSGELAFEAGDNDAAIAEERRALATLPNYAEGNRMLARVLCALHRWQDCLDAAKASASVVPYPEVLGYEFDAERALGDLAAARRTDDLIGAIARIGNANHVSDRLLAVYYAEHGERLADAYRIAQRELRVRDDIFTEDTLAWTAAMSGRWDEARVHAAKALRFDTENALVQYHAGIVALRAGDRATARRRLEKALALNAAFHPFYADDARAQLANLTTAVP